MWKCPNCETNNEDDRKYCVVCKFAKPESPVRFGTSAEDAYSYGRGRYETADSRAGNPSPRQPVRPVPTPLTDEKAKTDETAGKGKKKSRLIPIVAGIAAAVVILALLLGRGDHGNGDSAGQRVQAVGSGGAYAIVSSGQGSDIAMAAAPGTTVAPAVTPDAVSLYLDFGETYQCNTRDFDLPYAIDNDDVSWSCALNASGTRCFSNGEIVGGNIQVDMSEKYNDMVLVTGTTSNGSELTYYVTTGDGKAYDFQWSESKRRMKAYYGQVIVISPMIENCTGFTLYYEYVLSEGKIDSNFWSVWVRENGTDWVYIQDITLENNVGETNDIVFDRPISFSEVAVQPQKQNGEFTYSDTCGIGYLVFGS
jgi:hypothetical protein